MATLGNLWKKNTDKVVEVMPEETMGIGRSIWQAVQHLLTASGANIVGPVLMHPVVLAMVVIAIGFLLAPTAYSMAFSNLPLGLLTFVLGVVFAAKFRKGSVISALPVLLSIVIAYIVALIFGQVDLKPVIDAPFFTLPRIILPVFDVRACVPMGLVTLTAVLMEHLGHLQGTGSIVGVALLGIVLNLVLNWGSIVAEVRAAPQEVAKVTA